MLESVEEEKRGEVLIKLVVEWKKLRNSWKNVGEELGRGNEVSERIGGNAESVEILREVLEKKGNSLEEVGEVGVELEIKRKTFKKFKNW